MCFFITLVIRGASSELSDTMARHGRVARPVNGAALQSILLAGETQFLTTVDNCDCGSVLGAPPSPGFDREGEALRLRRKGWSAAKIERALNDREKAEDRPGKPPLDTLAFWGDVVRDVVALPGVEAAGLLIHSYSGDIESAVFAPARRDRPAAEVDAALAGMGEDELLMFSRR